MLHHALYQNHHQSCKMSNILRGENTKIILYPRQKYFATLTTTPSLFPPYNNGLNVNQEITLTKKTVWLNNKVIY